MNQKTKEKFYKEYVGLIKQISRSFYKTNPALEYDDIEGEANACFALSLYYYNPESNIAFSTYLYKCIRNTLTGYCKKEMKNHNKEVRQNIEAVAYYDTSDFFNNWKNSLSSDAKEAINVIFNAPRETIESYKSHKITYTSLINHLRIYKGWKWSKIEMVRWEIREALNNYI